MCGTTHGWTASHQLTPSLTNADNIFPRQAIDPGIALGPVCSTNCCRHSQQKWDAGRSTASSNHCFIVASFPEQLGNKLAAGQHHGRAPAASWFQVDTGERPFVINPTLPQLQRCLGGSLVALVYSNSSFSSQKAAAMHSNTSHIDSKFKNAIPETETAYTIRPRSIVYII